MGKKLRIRFSVSSKRVASGIGKPSYSPLLYSSREEYQQFLELWEKREKCYRWLRYHRLELGLRANASERSKQLFLIHENGSPIDRIPARSVMVSVKSLDVKRTIENYFEESLECARNGDLDGTKNKFYEAGKYGKKVLQDYIDSHIPPPNAYITLHGGWMRSPKSGKLFYVEPKKGDTPLVNTGAYRKDFGYEITEK